MLKLFTFMALTLSVLVNAVALWRVADWTIVPALIIGWLVADIMSGLVHILFDYLPVPAKYEIDRIFFHPTRNSAEYTRLKTQLLRRAGPVYHIAFDFKVHHLRPEAFGHRSFWKLTRAIVLPISLPFSLAVNALALTAAPPAWFLAAAIVLTLGSALSQYFHSALHRTAAPAPIRALQKLRLLMSPADHEKHHLTYRTAFCTINGWGNPLVDRVFLALHRRGLLTEAGLEPPRALRPDNAPEPAQSV